MSKQQGSHIKVTDEVLTAALKVKPLGARAVIYRGESVGVSRGGILIPDVAKEKAQIGHVISVGPGEYNKYMGDTPPMTIKAGDVVFFNVYGGSPITVDHVEFLVIREEEILAVMPGGE